MVNTQPCDGNIVTSVIYTFVSNLNARSLLMFHRNVVIALSARGFDSIKGVRNFPHYRLRSGLEFPELNPKPKPSKGICSIP